MESKNQPTADFINIVAWGKTAEVAANYLQKGKLVGIQGRLQSGKYEDKDGNTIYTTDVVVNNLEMIEWPDKDTTNNTSAPEGFNNVSQNGNPIPF